MSFGVDKCATISIRKGKAEKLCKNVQGIEELQPDAAYKYLGIQQNIKLDHSEIKHEFTEKYKKRVTKILNTKLAGKNIITAINSWAVPMLIYSFGIVKWSDVDLNSLDRLTRGLLTKFRCLHPNSSVIRLYLPRREGGRGLLNIFKLCRTQEQKMRDAILRSQDSLMQKVVSADNGYTPLNLSTQDTNTTVPTLKEEIQNWQQMILHGKFPNSLLDPMIDKSASLKWLSNGFLYPETEGFVAAIQDRVIRTKNYEKHILKTNDIDKCRRCGNNGESIEHIMAGCSTLSESAYLGRHNQVAKLIHREVGMKLGMLGNNAPAYYKYEPDAVLETKTHVLYWDRPIMTDKTVDHNRPDILIIDKEKKTASIIDVAIPLTRNLRKSEAEKLRKYENLAIELKNIWKLHEVSHFPMVISAEGVVTRNFKRNLEKLDIKNIFDEAQKATLLQTCHIVRKFLNE